VAIQKRVDKEYEQWELKRKKTGKQTNIFIEGPNYVDWLLKQAQWDQRLVGPE